LADSSVREFVVVPVRDRAAGRLTVQASVDAASGSDSKYEDDESRDRLDDPPADGRVKRADLLAG